MKIRAYLLRPAALSLALALAPSASALQQEAAPLQGPLAAQVYKDPQGRFGLTAPAEDAVPYTVEGEVSRHLGQGLCAIPQIQHVPDLRGLPRQAGGVVIRDPHEALGVGEGQRAEQQGVDHAEDGRACADPEAGDGDREQGESRIAPQGANCVAKVLEEA